MKSAVATRVLFALDWTIAQLRQRLKKGLRPDSVIYKVRRVPSMAARKAFADPRALTQDGVFCRREEMPMCSLFPKEMLDWVLNAFRPASVLDLGCGIGRSLDYFLGNGIDALGVEG